MNTITYEIAQDRTHISEWRVEGIDEKTGDIYVTLFAGPDSEKRAREYYEWKKSEI